MGFTSTREVTMNVSSEIAWGIIRDNSCFLLKKRGVKKPFSTEACNLTNRSLHKTKASLNKQRYRKDLTKAAMRRAAAIVRSQKPLPKRKGSKIAAAKKE